MKKMRGKEGWGRWKLEQEVRKISQNETTKALKRMKNGEAAGPELWKRRGERAMEFSTKLFSMTVRRCPRNGGKVY